MFWIEALALLAIWLGYGFLLWRRAPSIRANIIRIDRSQRIVAGSVLMVSSAALLLAGLLAVDQLRGSTADGLKPWALALVGLIGLAFVHMQAIAATVMTTLVGDDVTKADDHPSTRVEHEPEP